MTAEQRRAAGEAEFCDCIGCVFNARKDTWGAVNKRPDYLSPECAAKVGALLRALVLQSLLDPGTWARDAVWCRCAKPQDIMYGGHKGTCAICYLEIPRERAPL
jgi:hypothetical protein